VREIRQSVDLTQRVWPTPEVRGCKKKARIVRGPKKLIIIGVRVDDEWQRTLASWISENEPGMSQPEAIRRLVEQGLKAKPR
jgi:hypothetical protein